MVMAAGSCEGKVALITGASRGIGRAIAFRLAGEGAKVALVARNLDRVHFGRSLAHTTAAIGANARAYPADLSCPHFDPHALLRQIEAQQGPVDICINNAAIAVTRAFTDWTIEDLRRLQQANNWSPWLIVQALLPGMMDRGRGWIVNIGSSSATAPGVLLGSSAYSATKAMLHQWTKVLAAEFAHTPIVINALMPQGAALTESVEAAMQAGHLPRDVGEPLSVMAEAALVMATIPPGSYQGQVCSSLEFLTEVARPIVDFKTGLTMPGYDLAMLRDRLTALRGA
jgi:NAD(P)-dependent dehydrogenase (short-subunit alcohol dehydrogenase family)